MNLSFFYVPEEWSELTALWKEWLPLVAEREGRRISDLSYNFLGDDALLDINRKHLNHDFYTDVITFDYSSGKRIRGEVFCSIDRIKDNAEQSNLSPVDERDRVGVHALLHLCGHGDKMPSEILKMRELEDFYLLLRPNVSRGTR